jgi:uncharacterized membrane protein
MVSARARFGLALLIGLAVGAACWGLTGRLRYGLLGLVITTAVVCVVWTFVTLWRLDAGSTATHAIGEDVGPVLSDLMVIALLAASVVAIGVLLTSSTSATELVDAGLALVAVLCVWALLHTIFSLRYARLYYRDPPGGIDFNTDDPPRYSDFFYFGFNLGMAYQVSDTAVRTSEIRAVVLRHGVLSYLFGTLVLAAAINLVLGLVG